MALGKKLPPELEQLVVAESVKRLKAKTAVRMEDLCFPAQLDFVQDKATFVAALCSRRAGKSEGCVIKLLKAASENPRSIAAYVTITKPMAKRIMWSKLVAWNERLKLGGHFNQNTLEMTLPNGSVVALYSAETDEEVEKMRGQAYPLVVIDEAQAIKPGLLKKLVEEIVPPALMDYNGQLYLTGTPNSACAGYFYLVTTGKKAGYKVHHWNAFDNPHLKNAREFVDNILKLWNMGHDAPKAQREFYGKWVRDNSTSVFAMPDTALIDEMPKADDWEYVVGMDFGYKDATAFVVIGYSIDIGRAVVVQSWEERHLLPDDVAERAEKLFKTYRPIALVGDVGGLGKPYAETMVQRYSLPIDAAEKSQKLAAIEVMNTDLRAGKLLILSSNAELWEQMRSIEWDYSKAIKKAGITEEDQELRNIQRADVMIDERAPNHIADACLYAHRRTLQYLHTDPVDISQLDGESKEEREMEAMADRLMHNPLEHSLSDELLPEGRLF